MVFAYSRDLLILSVSFFVLFLSVALPDKLISKSLFLFKVYRDGIPSVKNTILFSAPLLAEFFNIAAPCLNPSPVLVDPPALS